MERNRRLMLEGEFSTWLIVTLFFGLLFSPLVTRLPQFPLWPVLLCAAFLPFWQGLCVVITRSANAPAKPPSTFLDGFFGGIGCAAAILLLKALV